jgi:hypothetical protein
MAKRRGKVNDYLVVVPVLVVAALLAQVGPSFDVLEWVTMIGVAALIVGSVLATVWLAFLGVMNGLEVFGGLVSVGVGGLEMAFSRKVGRRWGLPLAVAVAGTLVFVGVVSVLHLLLS